MQTLTRTHTRRHTHAYAHAYGHMACAHVHVSTHARVRTRVYTRADTHAHTYADSSVQENCFPPFFSTSNFCIFKLNFLCYQCALVMSSGVFAVFGRLRSSPLHRKLVALLQSDRRASSTCCMQNCSHHRYTQTAICTHG